MTQFHSSAPNLSQKRVPFSESRLRAAALPFERIWQIEIGGQISESGISTTLFSVCNPAAVSFEKLFLSLSLPLFSSDVSPLIQLKDFY